MSEINPNTFENDPELIEALRNCGTPWEMQKAYADHVAKHGGVRSNLDPTVIIDASRVRAPEPTIAPKFERDISINGVTQHFSADSETAIWKEIAAGYEQSHAAQSQNQTPAQQDAPVYDESSPKYRADMMLALQRGELTPAEFIAKFPSALDEYARTRLGIDPQEVQNQRDQQPWITASEQFLQNHPEWPGMDVNRDTLMQIIESNPELMEGDHLQALETAYNYARENNLIQKNAMQKAEEMFEAAKTPEELRQAALATQGRTTDSSFWGR